MLRKLCQTQMSALSPFFFFRYNAFCPTWDICIPKTTWQRFLDAKKKGKTIVKRGHPKQLKPAEESMLKDLVLQRKAPNWMCQLN